MPTSEEKNISKVRFPSFRDRFVQLQGDKTIDAFAKELGISRATAGFYRTGTRIPDALGIKNIATACNVSADWLLGLADNSSRDTDINQVCDFTGLPEKAVEWMSRNQKSGLGLEGIRNVFAKVITSRYIDKCLYQLWDGEGRAYDLKEASSVSKRIIGVLREKTSTDVKELKESKSSHSKEYYTADFHLSELRASYEKLRLCKFYASDSFDRIFDEITSFDLLSKEAEGYIEELNEIMMQELEKEE